MISIETFVRILDLGGTFVFAISGAVAAINRRLDILASSSWHSWPEILVGLAVIY